MGVENSSFFFFFPMICARPMVTLGSLVLLSSHVKPSLLQLYCFYKEAIFDFSQMKMKNAIFGGFVVVMFFVGCGLVVPTLIKPLE